MFPGCPPLLFSRVFFSIVRFVRVCLAFLIHDEIYNDQCCVPINSLFEIDLALVLHLQTIMVLQLTFKKNANGQWEHVRKTSKNDTVSLTSKPKMSRECAAHMSWASSLGPEPIPIEVEKRWPGYWKGPSDDREWVVVGPCSIRFKVVNKGKTNENAYWQAKFKRPIPGTFPPQTTINYNCAIHGTQIAEELAQRHKITKEQAEFHCVSC